MIAALHQCPDDQVTLLSTHHQLNVKVIQGCHQAEQVASLIAVSANDNFYHLLFWDSVGGREQF